MSSSEFSTKPRNSAHWTVKSNYPLRTGSFILTFIMVSLHVWDKGYSSLFWGILVLALLIYPHFAFWRARRCLNSQQAEVHNLVIDAVLFGIIVSVIQFPIVITFNVFIACIVNMTITRGIKGTILELAAFLSGAVIPGVILGWHFSPDTSLSTTLVALLSNALYMILIGIAANGRNNQLRKIRETLRQNENKLKHQIIEIQDLQIKLQVKSEKEIKSLQNYLSNIIQSMPSALISIDENGKVTQWNAAAEKIIGIKAIDILGKELWNAQTIMQKFENNYYDVIKMKKPIYFHRKPIVDSSNKLFNISIYPLISNGITGVVLRMDDVTDIEKMEEQLRQAQKMETVGTLAGGLAHDFNNVLGGIVGTVSILKFKLSKGLELPIKSLKDYVETIESAGQRAADMVQQLLTLSRKQEISFAPVDLNLTIKHVFKICSNTIDKAVEIKPCYTKEPAMVSADPGQMEQVLLNLTVNAGHAMTIMRPQGEHQGGVLTIALKTLQADKFFCSSHPEAQEMNYWVLSVQDTGAGMDSKTIAKIFDPFFTTKEKGKGTGLGLAMVYNIVQQHKGFIDVYSEIGHGTTFNVYLPSIEAVQGAAACQEELKIAQGEGIILVVDDEAIMRELAQEILEECGYQVLLAENGEEGVEVFRKEHKRIAMVLLDMVMPKKSGKEAFIEMKKIDPNVKVLLASGFRKDDRVEEIINLGLTGFIQKPYTIEKLAEAVQEAITG